MLSRIGRFFRRLGGEQDQPPTTEQDQPESRASRQQDESDLLASDVIGRTRSIAVSDRSIHQARSVAVTDTRPMATPARPQVRRDIPTQALPFAVPRETLPPVESTPSDTAGPVGTTFEGDSTGDSEWDALWHLRGTVQGPSHPAMPVPPAPPTSSPATGSDRPASPPASARGSVQRTPEPGPTIGEGTSRAEPGPLVREQPQPERGRTPAAPTARQPMPRPAAPTGEVQRRPAPRIARETPSEGEPGPVQRQELEAERPEMEAPAADVRAESTGSAVPPVPMQRPVPSAEHTTAPPSRTPVQRSLDEPRPSIPAYPAGEDEPRTEPEVPVAPPKSGIQSGRQSAPEPQAPAQPAVQRQVDPTSGPAREPDALPPDAASSPQPTAVQPMPAEVEPMPPPQQPLQRLPGLEAPEGESLVDTGVEAVAPEEAPPPSRTAPAEPTAPPVARSIEPTGLVPESREMQESPRVTGALPRPQPAVPEPVPPATPGIQRAVEPEIAPVSTPEPSVSPEPVALPPVAVAPPGTPQAPTAQRTEATEPFRALPLQREPESVATPPAPGLPEAVSAEAPPVEGFEPVPDLVQQHVDQREALRQAMQPRIVPTVVQRAVEERETEQTPSAGEETGSEAEGEQGPNIEALAKDVYRILRKKLLVERERDPGRI